MYGLRSKSDARRLAFSPWSRSRSRGLIIIKLLPCGSGVIFVEFNLATEMAKKVDFENGEFREFKCSVTLTLTLDHLENHIVRFVSSTSIHNTI